jgi:hypothetical protein
MRVLVYGCFCTFIVQRTILKALCWRLRSIPDESTYELPVDVGDLSASGVYILMLVMLVI